MGKLLKVSIVLPRSEEETSSIALDGSKDRSGFIVVRDILGRVHLEPIAYTRAILKGGTIIRTPSLRTVRTHECECEKCGRMIAADFAVLKASGVPHGTKVRVSELERAICPTCGSLLHDFSEHVFSEESLPDNIWDYVNQTWAMQEEDPTQIRKPYLYGALPGAVHEYDYEGRSELFRALMERAQCYEHEGQHYPLIPKGIDEIGPKDRPVSLWLLAPEVSSGTLSFEELLALKSCGTPKFPQFLGVRLPKLPPKPKTKNIPFGVNIVL